jgi:ribonucleoside-triphosphate reductase
MSAEMKLFNEPISKTTFKTSLTTLLDRDGKKKEFDASKIFTAIKKASDASEKELSDDELLIITNKILRTLESKFNNTGNLVKLEEIQDIAEITLLNEGQFEIAKKYIAYRAKRAQARADKKTLIDAAQTIDEYINNVDWRINENANIDYSLGGMILKNSGKIVANYWLSHIYPEEVGASHREGDAHIHDLDFLAGYCAGWSLRMLLEEGYNGVKGFTECGPPKHLSAAVGQMVNFMGTLQNEFAGAQAFSSVDTYLAPFVRVDNLSYKDVYQAIQTLVYNLNVPSRWGTQTPFTNFTFDWVCPPDLRSVKPKIGNKDVDFTYGDLQEEMDMINQAYIEVMTAGDAKGRPFTFPIPTYNITEDFPWDSPKMQPLFEMTAKFGVPYFQNFLNSDLKPTDVRSMCCRLRLDVRELLKRGNGLFGSAEQTGSVGVYTINLARLGYVFKGDEAGLFKRLDYLLNLGKTSLELKRKTIQRLLDQGLYPFAKRYLGTWKNHFSTIGINGANEMIRNFTDDKYDLTSEWGQNFTIRVLEHIREKLKEFQEETGNMYNLEATPAEGATYRFAKEDKKRYPDIIQAGTTQNNYYTNSSQLPVDYSEDPFEVLELQEELQKQYTGGTVLHMYLGERMKDGDTCKNFIRRVFENYQIPYLTITPTFSMCPVHGYISGEHEYCPLCDQELEKQSKLDEQIKTC